jgi:hypothetical protein
LFEQFGQGSSLLLESEDGFHRFAEEFGQLAAREEFGVFIEPDDTAITVKMENRQRILKDCGLRCVLYFHCDVLPEGLGLKGKGNSSAGEVVVEENS